MVKNGITLAIYIEYVPSGSDSNSLHLSLSNEICFCTH